MWLVSSPHVRPSKGGQTFFYHYTSLLSVVVSTPVDADVFYCTLQKRFCAMSVQVYVCNIEIDARTHKLQLLYMKFAQNSDSDDFSMNMGT